MRLAETCCCGAGLEVEGAPPAVVDAVDRWRQGHRCPGVDGWRRAAGSADNLAHTEIATGFGPAEVRA